MFTYTTTQFNRKMIKRAIWLGITQDVWEQQSIGQEQIQGKESLLRTCISERDMIYREQ